MITHQAIGKNANVKCLLDGQQQLNERFEVAVFMKDILSAVSSVKNVVYQAVAMSSCYSRHLLSSKSSLSPFCSFVLVLSKSSLSPFLLPDSCEGGSVNP
ncbi:MAG TPA: hypothetical protein VN132_12270, partial [Bdellovibrio sp.]|nr:hypothetical protein [Bdellovibrio sp.]